MQLVSSINPTAACASLSHSLVWPAQGLFLVLVTNKQSNILEDLDTLRLLSKVVPEYCSVRPETHLGESQFTQAYTCRLSGWPSASRLSVSFASDLPVRYNRGPALARLLHPIEGA